MRLKTVDRFWLRTGDLGICYNEVTLDKEWHGVMKVCDHLGRSDSWTSEVGEPWFVFCRQSEIAVCWEE